MTKHEQSLLTALIIALVLLMIGTIVSNLGAGRKETVPAVVLE